MSNRTERKPHRLRRVLMILPLSLLLIGFAAKVAVMQTNNSAGLSDYEQGFFVGAGERFESNRTLNLFSPWVAPFNHGTAVFQEGDLTQAEADFREALAKRPGSHRCKVTLNLVWTLETRGDQQAAAGQEAAARTSYQSAQQELDASGCQNRPADEQDAAQQTRERLADKLDQDADQQQNQTPTPSPSQSQTPTPSSRPSEAAASKSSELADRNRSAEQADREANETYEMPDYPVDKPW